MEIEKPAVLKVFLSLGAAELVATELRARGISCALVTDDAGGMFPALQLGEGVKVVVSTADLEIAQRIVEDAPLESALASESNPAAESAPQPKAARLYFGPGLLVGMILGAAAFWAWDRHRFSDDHTYSVDNNDDGRSDEFWVYRDGQRTAGSRDRNFDGKIDYWEFFTDGQFVRSESDENFDGTVDSWSSYTNGSISIVKMDTDFNGLPDVSFLYSNGILRKAAWRTNQNSQVTKEDWYEHGVCREELRDEDGDGQFDVRVTFDAFANPIRTNLLPKKLLLNR